MIDQKRENLLNLALAATEADQRMAEYKKRLVDLENNIWNR